MSRIEHARRKVRIAQVAIGIGTAAGLAVFAGLARASHPGAQHPRTTSSSRSSRATTAVQGSDFFFGGDDGSAFTNIGPSGSAAPQVQSGGS